jgi:hypothetical protein
MAIHKSAIQRVRHPIWMSAQTVQVLKIHSAWHAVATPPNIVSTFKQTGLHSIWDWRHRALAMLVDMAPAPKLERERAVDEAKRQQFRINIRPRLMPASNHSSPDRSSRTNLRSNGHQLTVV